MANKRYPDKVISELSQSAFFRPTPPAPIEAEEDGPEPSSPTPEADTSISRTNQRSNVRTNERPKARRKIRHTFDIFADQLMSLREIALERESETGDRVLLGDLAQEALDMLITKERTK